MKQCIYVNGDILTMDERQTAQAVLVQNGKIAYVGSKEEAKAKALPNTPQVDLQGRCMMPAFIDPHSHFSGMANGRLQVDLGECTSFAQIEQAVRQFVMQKSIAPGQWVLAKGYDHNRLQEKAHPPLALLDKACPQNPLVLQHQSGHVGVFNSPALKALGVDETTPSPDGGRIEQKDGRLTGYMEENAFVQYLKKVPMPSIDQLLTAYAQAQQEYASFGITTVQEGMLARELIPLYQALLASNLLKLDVVGYADIAAKEEIKKAFAGHIGQYKGHFKLGGYKIFLDGSPQGRTAWMRAPYSDEEEYCGYPILTDDMLLQDIICAVQEHMQLLAHCNGDAACAQYLQCVQKAAGQGLNVKAIRPVVIHAQLIGRDQLADAKRLGLLLSFFVAHVYYWGDVHIRNFGLSRAKYISPALSAQKAGIPFTFHQDSPVLPPDMLKTVWCAVKRQTQAGVTLGEEEALSVHDALRAVTIQAAYQYFEERQKGSITQGKNADFVILERNPLQVEIDELPHIKVLQTIKDGQAIFTRA